MVLEKMESQVIDQCIVEMNKNDTIEKVKNKLIKPCFEHIYNYFHSYIILFYLSLIFLCISIIIMLFLMLKIFNKVASLETGQI